MCPTLSSKGLAQLMPRRMGRGHRRISSRQWLLLEAQSDPGNFHLAGRHTSMTADKMRVIGLILGS